ncbi:hypothetical protein WSK_2033, partial [Novosphingobium sp. Rr 2-17]
DGYWAAVGLLALALAGHQGFSTNLFGLIADITPRYKVGRVTGFGYFVVTWEGLPSARSPVSFWPPGWVTVRSLPLQLSRTSSL